MSQLPTPPFNLISLLHERLSSEDVRVIADDYGERCGRDDSLYYHLIERAGIDHVVRLLVLYAERRKDIMGLIRVVCEYRADLHQPLQESGFELSSLLQTYLTATMKEFSRSESNTAAPLTLRYVIKNVYTFEGTQKDLPSSFSQSPPTPSRFPATPWLEVDLEELFLSHSHITLFGSDRLATVNTLRHMFERLAVSWQASDPTSPIPIFADLGKWFNPQMNLVQFLQFQISWMGIPQLAEQIPHLLRTRRIVLLFGGLDKLPYAKRNETTGLLDDPRFHAITRLGDKFSQESGWRNIRCVLSYHVKDFAIKTHWHDLFVLDPAYEHSISWHAAPAYILKAYVNQVMGREISAGRITDSQATELQTRLGFLAFNMTDAKRRSAEKQLAAAWLHSLREIEIEKIERSEHMPETSLEDPEVTYFIPLPREIKHAREPEASLEEQQQAARLLRIAEEASLLSSTENNVRFLNQYIQQYFCLCYCRSQALDDSQFLSRVSHSEFREMWLFWFELDLHLADKLQILLMDSDSSDLRRDIVHALCWLNDNRTVEPLITALEDTDEQVRHTAIQALIEINDKRIIEPLTKAIKLDFRNISQYDVSRLCEIHDTWVIEPLIAFLHGDSTYGLVNERVIDALVEFGEAAVLPLLTVITPEEVRVDYTEGKKSYMSYPYLYGGEARYYAAEILGKIGDLRSLPFLMWMVERDSGETRFFTEVKHAAAEAVRKILRRHYMPIPLIAALENTDNAVRIGAAFALGERGDNRALEPLIAALQHEEPYVRWGAARLLGKIGDPRAITPVIAALKDKEYTVGNSAAEALFKIGESAVLPLIAALRDEDRKVSSQAALVLGKLGNMQAVEPLIAVLTDQHSQIRLQAIYALGWLRDRRALEPLLAAANDSNAEVREAVPSAVRTIEPSLAVEVLIVALKDENKEVRRGAANDLGRFGDSRAVEPLIEALKDEYHYVREYAGYALIKHGDLRAVEPLIEALNDEWEYAAIAAARALGAIGDRRAIEPLVAALKKEYDQHCSTVAETLLTFGESVTSPLIAALDDEGPNASFYSSSTHYWDRGMRTKLIKKAHLHYYAAEILGKIGDVLALPVLMWMAEKDQNETEYGKEKVLDAAAQAFESIRQRYQDIAVLLAALDDQDALVRIGVGFALGSLGDRRATEMLIDALKDADRRTRWGAARLLGNLGGDQAIAPLTHALGDEDTEVRRNAAAALIKIGGEPAVLMLIAAFGNEYSDAYPWIAYVLKEIGAVAVPPLIAALRTEHSARKDWIWFEWIAHTLSQIGEAALHPLLVALKDQDRSVRYWVANALGLLGNSQAVGPLTSALEDEDPIVRLSAAAALTKLGNSKAFELLIEALKEADENIRVAAILNLGETRSDRAVEPLIATLNDENTVIRYFAVGALGEIGDSRALPALERLVKVTKQLPRVPEDQNRELADAPENQVETVADDSQADLVDDQLRTAARQAIKRIQERQK